MIPDVSQWTNENGETDYCRGPCNYHIVESDVSSGPNETRETARDHVISIFESRTCPVDQMKREKLPGTM